MGTGKTGGHWKPCNIGSVEAHNERRPDYLEAVKKAGLSLYFFENLTEHNDHWVNDNVRYKDKTVAEVFEVMKKLYQEKTGQLPQLADKIKVNKKSGKEYKCAGWSPIREMCVPIKEDTKIEDFDYLKKWAKKHGIEIIRIDLHKDEGYYDKDTGKYNMNYHAHVVASFLDWGTGKTVKPNNQAMSEMQTILAMALDMERGERKADTGRVYLDHTQYREMMEAVDGEKEKVKAELADKQQQFDTINAELAKVTKKLKGLTTMIANLEEQRDNIEAQIAALEDEYQDATKDTIKKIEELKEQLTALDTKLLDKQQKLRTAEQQLRDLDGQTKRLNDQKENLEKGIKIMADDAIRRHDNLNAKMKETEKAIEEKRAEVARIDKTGELNRAYKHIKDRDAVIYRHWPEAQAAVKAIYERASSMSAREFTQQQALDVEKAIGTSGISRNDAANELLSLTMKEFDNNRTWQAWIEDTANEVLSIAQEIHFLTPFLQQYSNGGGGGVGNTDLPKKKEDDRNTGYQAMKPKGRK